MQKNSLKTLAAHEQRRVQAGQENQMTLEQQWQEDVKQFGELAYLMWEVLTKWIIDFSFAFDGNFTVECALNDERSGVKRKPSAALPFDLAAARAGDEVQLMIFGQLVDFDFLKWLKNGSIQLELENVEFSYPSDLRMKHPRRVGVDYSQFED